MGAPLTTGSPSQLGLSLLSSHFRLLICYKKSQFDNGGVDPGSLVEILNSKTLLTQAHLNDNYIRKVLRFRPMCARALTSLTLAMVASL